jgi:hypothetical protein
VISDGQGPIPVSPIFVMNASEAERAAVTTDRVMAMGYHFPFPAIGHVVRNDGAYPREAVQWAW